MKMVGLFGKTLTLDVPRRLRFSIHAAGWLHAMVFHGRGFVALMSTQAPEGGP